MLVASRSASRRIQATPPCQSNQQSMSNSPVQFVSTFMRDVLVLKPDSPMIRNVEDEFAGHEKSIS